MPRRKRIHSNPNEPEIEQAHFVPALEPIHPVSGPNESNRPNSGGQRSGAGTGPHHRSENRQGNRPDNRRNNQNRPDNRQENGPEKQAAPKNQAGPVNQTTPDNPNRPDNRTSNRQGSHPGGRPNRRPGYHSGSRTDYRANNAPDNRPIPGPDAPPANPTDGNPNNAPAGERNQRTGSRPGGRLNNQPGGRPNNQPGRRHNNQPVRNQNNPSAERQNNPSGGRRNNQPGSRAANQGDNRPGNRQNNPSANEAANRSGNRARNHGQNRPNNRPNSGPNNRTDVNPTDRREDTPVRRENAPDNRPVDNRPTYSRPSGDRPDRRAKGNRPPRGRSFNERDPERLIPSEPIHTNRGIKARSQRGTFSKNWWAHRWIESMEQLVDPLRLQRGRSYARTGQVLTIQETQHGVEAKVQGSRPQPYKVNIQVTPLTDEQWDQVTDALAEQALFTAQLLAGEMPENIEDAFNTAGVSLFPSEAGDLFTSCSCPDWANPCKHVAATHYILGDLFDDDPFLLFRMRGRSQEQILQALRAQRAGLGEMEPEAPVVEAEPQTGPALEESLDHFWEPVESLDTFPLTINPPSVDMPLLKRLGEPNFINGEPLQTLLKPVYDTFTRSAFLAAYSEEEPVEPSNGSADCPVENPDLE